MIKHVSRCTCRWVHAHLFSGYLADEAIELLVAHVYINPRPYGPPASPLCGFLRVLSLLAEFNWASQPLIVNLDGQMTAKDYADVQVRSRYIPFWRFLRLIACKSL